VQRGVRVCRRRVPRVCCVYVASTGPALPLACSTPTDSIVPPGRAPLWRTRCALRAARRGPHQGTPPRGGPTASTSPWRPLLATVQRTAARRAAAVAPRPPPVAARRVERAAPRWPSHVGPPPLNGPRTRPPAPAAAAAAAPRTAATRHCASRFPFDRGGAGPPSLPPPTRRRVWACWGRATRP